MSWAKSARSAWEGLSGRERRIGALTAAMALGLLIKLAAIDPVQNSLGAARAVLAAKQAELSQAREQTASLSAKAGGRGQAREAIARLKQKSARLDERARALKGAWASGPQALELMGVLERAAGAHLKEVSIAPALESAQASQTGAALGRGRLRMAMGGGFSDWSKALEEIARSAPALRLQKIALSQRASGEGEMIAEFAALGADISWQLPEASNRPRRGE